MGEHPCRFEHCNESRDTIRRLFLHESEEHGPPANIKPVKKQKRFNKPFDEARTVSIEQPDEKCQNPTCDPHDNPTLDPETRIDEEKSLEAHHLKWRGQLRNHSDHLTILCQQCHFTIEDNQGFNPREFTTPVAEDPRFIVTTI